MFRVVSLLAAFLARVVVSGPALAAEPAAIDSAAGNAALRLEYGATLALTGDLDGAEAIFSALLTAGPGAAAAWSNLGNVHLIRGDAEIARDLYDHALEVDPEGWGIFLNRSVARMLLGDERGSREDAARAMNGCGGPEAALALLGIMSRETIRPADETGRAPLLSEEDVRALLASALEGVPSDSTRHDASEASEDDQGSHSTWRPAGTRAAGGTDLARMLYWRY